MNRNKWTSIVLLALVLLLATATSGPTGAVREYRGWVADSLATDRDFCTIACTDNGYAGDCGELCGGLNVLWDSGADGANGPAATKGE
jgi:hypothetical protein